MNNLTKAFFLFINLFIWNKYLSCFRQRIKFFMQKDQSVVISAVNGI